MRHTVYKNYLLVILMVILTINYQDRWALGLVLQEIKVEYSLSDAQLGLLTGIAFAFFYSVMGIPLARWADRGNRVTLIVVAVALWSLMVSLCGVATSFVQLLLIRVGVAVGEAGCMPTAHSLIPDYFTRAERPRAVAIFLLGAPLSLVTGNFLAGWLNEHYGWRVMFIVLGLPGLGLAALAQFTLRDPRHGEPTRYVISISTRLSQLRSASSVPPSLHEACMRLWAIPTFRHMLLNFVVVSFFNIGLLQWQPTFFVRSYGLRTDEVGIWFTLIYGVCGLVGTYLGGPLASRYAAHNERLQLRAMTVVYLSVGVLFFCVYLSRSPFWAFGLMGVIAIAGSATNAPLFAVIQSLVPERMRAMSIALIYLCANLIGMGLGPLAAGALSDTFRSWAGEESLRYALLALTPGYFWAAWHVWRGSKSITADMAAVHAGGQAFALEPVSGVDPCPNRAP